MSANEDEHISDSPGISLKTWAMRLIPFWIIVALSMMFYVTSIELNCDRIGANLIDCNLSRHTAIRRLKPIQLTKAKVANVEGPDNAGYYSILLNVEDRLNSVQLISTQHSHIAYKTLRSINNFLLHSEDSHFSITVSKFWGER